MTSPHRIVTDYSCGLPAGRFPTLTIVAPDAEHQRRGDPPSRAAYAAAFANVLPEGPLPVICLVGPYGYSAAQTSASGARNDLGRQKLPPDGVRVFNTGRGFLGLGALTAVLAMSDLGPEAAFKWLDEAAPKTTCWLIARTEALHSAPPEAHLEAPEGLPDAEFSLLRVRLASRLIAGFASAEGALADALKRAAAPERSLALTVSPPGFHASPASVVPSETAIEVPLPLALRQWFGDCLAFAIAPLPAQGAPHA